VSWTASALARVLAAYVAEPARFTATQMDRWCRDFDNWAVCDAVCEALFARTPHAWRKVAQWSGRRDEHVRRATESDTGPVTEVLKNPLRVSAESFNSTSRCRRLASLAITGTRCA
jgi:hypothetical protein